MARSKNIGVLGLIPARGGSKGIPRKNLADLCGKPLIQYTFESALRSRELDRVILSTDDGEIAALGRRCGVEVPFMRPKALAEDRTPMAPVVEHALGWLQEAEGGMCDAVALLQPTSPLCRSRDIDGAVGAFREGGMDAVVGVCEPREHPFDMLVPGERGARFLIPNDRGCRQEFPTCYYVNGAIYVTASRVLLEQHTFFPERMGIFPMDWISSFDIDTPLDLEIAAAFLRLRKEGGGP